MYYSFEFFSFFLHHKTPDRWIFFGAFFSILFLIFLHFATALLPYSFYGSFLIVFMNMYITHSTTAAEAEVAATKNTFKCSQSNRSLIMATCVWVFLCSFDQWIGNFFIQILFSNYVLAAFNASFSTSHKWFASLPPPLSLPFPYVIFSSFFLLLIHPNTQTLTHSIRLAFDARASFFLFTIQFTN